MLCQWARRWGISGVGVDISKVFLAAARARADEMGVDDRVSFVEADAGKYLAEANGFDVVSCIGATWIGNGLVGTLELMQRALKPGGLLLVGEPYWIEPPPEAAVPSWALATMITPRCAARSTASSRRAANWSRWCWRTAIAGIATRRRSGGRSASGCWIIPTIPTLKRCATSTPRAKRALSRLRTALLGWGVFVLREQ